MSVLSTDEIDREIESCTKEVAAMAATLVELDCHPGLEHVRRYPPTGVTAQRWVQIEDSLAQLWEGLGTMTSILESVRSARARRTRLDAGDRAALTRLLRERSLEVSRERIPLAQRTISGPDEVVEYAGLADTADRMRAGYPAVVEFFDAVDEIDALVADGLAPVQKLLGATGLAAPEEIADLLTCSATDPLALTAHDVARRVAAITENIEQHSAELAELAALQSNWADAVTNTALRLRTLREATRQSAWTRARAEQTVMTGRLPEQPDAEPGLRAALQSILTPDPAALRSLRHRIDAALQAVRENEVLAQGLLDRHSELGGRLTAYQAKAARLGLGEDGDLLACGRIASGLLSRRPCDLRAVTRAIADYQQLLAEKRGRAR